MAREGHFVLWIFSVDATNKDVRIGEDFHLLVVFAAVEIFAPQAFDGKSGNGIRNKIRKLFKCSFKILAAELLRGRCSFSGVDDLKDSLPNERIDAHTLGSGPSKKRFLLFGGDRYRDSRWHKKPFKFNRTSPDSTLVPRSVSPARVRFCKRLLQNCGPSSLSPRLPALVQLVSCGKFGRCRCID